MPANPAPFGLTGFGLTTILLNLANCGVFPVDSMIIAMGICLGCTLQMIGGIGAYIAGKTASALTFCTYGLFWLSFSLTTIFNAQKTVTPTGDMGLAFYLFIFGCFSIFMMAALWKTNWVLRVTFITVILLFWLLALRHWMGYHNLSKQMLDDCSKVAGSVGVICGSLALYLGMAEVIEGEYGYEVLPIFKIAAPVASPKDSEHEMAKII